MFTELDNFYEHCIKILLKIQKRPRFKSVPQLDFGIYSSLFPDLEAKSNLWNDFSNRLFEQEKIIKNEILKNNFFPVYAPRYPQKRVKLIHTMLKRYRTDYQPVKIHALKTKETQDNLLPHGYFFDTEDSLLFHCPNGSTILFKEKKETSI